MEGNSRQTTLHQKFGKRFMEDHIGKMINDPEIALVELVANSWDAGARNVNIIWPEAEGGEFEIIDDGSGMSREEFEEIWPEFNYNRVSNQGTEVIFPREIGGITRRAFGRNGKGRHSMFCFSNNYDIETWKDGMCHCFQVKRSYGENALDIQLIKSLEKEGHGTKITCVINNNYINEDKVRELLGSKFSTDPSFIIIINDKKVDLFDLIEFIDERDCYIPELDQTVKILKIDSRKSGRTTQQHGVAWWVNNRLVIEQSWKDAELSYLDGRSSQAKRFTFIVLADILQDEVKPDWTGFNNVESVKEVKKQISTCIYDLVDDVMDDIRSEKRVKIWTDRKEKLKKMSKISRIEIYNFVEEIQKKCPTITDQVLSQTLDVFINMESARTGYALLQQLVHLSPEDVDDLNDILEKWSVNDAKKVLNELYLRLEIIKEIENLMDDPDTEELHQLHPLFERGLWIFGPEYDGVEFMSNRQILTVIEAYLAKKGFEFDTYKLKNPLKRPDFVVVPNDFSLGTYCSNHYGEDGETDGFDKILIVELKRGGSTITTKDRRQAEDYAEELVNCGKLQPFTKIVGYVLGSKIQTEQSTISENITITPMSFTTILNKANSRTFNLLNKIKEVHGITDQENKEMQEVLSEDLGDFLDL